MSEPLTADDFRRDRALPVERVEVPEFGGHCYVRTLTALERDRYEAGNFTVEKDGSRKLNAEGARGRLAVLVICNERGNRIFDDGAWRQVADLDGRAITRIVMRARRLNGMDDEAVEEAEKNSATAPS